MLLVDDDQAGMLERGEQRRAGADDDLRVALAGGLPGLQALAVGEARVQQGDARVEAAGEALEGLRAEVDLRDQHQRLPAGLQGLTDQLQVDLGLAAAGDPGQQAGVEAAETGTHRLEGAALFVVERQLRLQQPGAVVFGNARAAADHLDQALVVQQLEAVARQLELLEQVLVDAVRVLGEGRQRLALTRCAGQARVVEARAGGGLPEAFLTALGRLALAQQIGQRPAEGVAEAVLVVAGGPQAQLEQRRRQQRAAVEQGAGLAQALFRHLAVRHPFDQHADQFAAPERHAQTHAGLQQGGIAVGRGAVVEQAAQRRGQGKAQDGLGHAGAPQAKAGDLSTRCSGRRRAGCPADLASLGGSVIMPPYFSGWPDRPGETTSCGTWHGAWWRHIIPEDPKMKPEIHPAYDEVVATCSCGNVVKTRSTLCKNLSLDVCSECHPFYTGKQKVLDAGGRIDRFKQRFAGFGATK
ncbi:50S ribosomal protein L31 [compost metagenome]